MKFEKFKQVDKSQVWLIILVWLLILCMPLLSGKFDETINWGHIFRIWKETGIVFIVFLVNRFLLLPYLFFKHKKTAYFLITFILIVALTSLVFVFHQHPSMGQRLPEPPRYGFKKEIEFEKHKKIPQNDALEQPHPLNEPPGIPPPDFNLPPAGKMPIPPFSNVFIMCLLIVGFDTGLVLYTKWNKAMQTKLETEKENVETQMAFLKNQVSPHFFMNTLNNIHALVDIDPAKAKSSIISLSELMDYMLYESEIDYISLSKEIEFIVSYIELMKLRFNNKLDLKLEIPANLPKIKIPPLLTISFIENAFKYAIKPGAKSFIHIWIDGNEKEFIFKIENSIFKHTKSGRGIGVSNARKRLELIYGENYDLTINDNNNQFEVTLKVPV